MSALTYADYLQLDALMTLQKPQSPRDGPLSVRTGENFFIVTHQCCELWLSQVLLDLDVCVEDLTAEFGDLDRVEEGLRRCVTILDLLAQHVSVLDALPPETFAAFRGHLGTASGAQSPHFRALDAALGLGRGPSPALAALTGYAERRGLGLTDLWGPAGGRLGVVAGLLLDVGQAHWRWKVQHVALVARMLGSQPGTGGSSGVDHLLRRIAMPFPELREAQRLALLVPVDDTKVAS